MNSEQVFVFLATILFWTFPFVQTTRMQQQRRMHTQDFSHLKLILVTATIFFIAIVKMHIYAKVHCSNNNAFYRFWLQFSSTKKPWKPAIKHLSKLAAKLESGWNNRSHFMLNIRTATAAPAAFALHCSRIEVYITMLQYSIHTLFLGVLLKTLKTSTYHFKYAKAQRRFSSLKKFWTSSYIYPIHRMCTDIQCR